MSYQFILIRKWKQERSNRQISFFPPCSGQKPREKCSQNTWYWTKAGPTCCVRKKQHPCRVKCEESLSSTPTWPLRCVRPAHDPCRFFARSSLQSSRLRASLRGILGRWTWTRNSDHLQQVYNERVDKFFFIARSLSTAIERHFSIRSLDLELAFYIFHACSAVDSPGTGSWSRKLQLFTLRWAWLPKGSKVVKFARC